MAGSPAASTPTSAASPPPNGAVNNVAPRPSLYMKPMPIATPLAMNAGSPTGSLTTKEWIIPPRPKPGRKPATDTPPTKRKAQNRAAQRAFRERRAARVGELEEQIKQIEDDHDQQQEDLRVNITRLEHEVESYKNELSNWITRCRQLESELAHARSQPPVELPPPTSLPPLHQDGISHQESAVGCGNCTLDTRCQCLDDVVNAMNEQSNDFENPSSEKRPSSPLPTASEKRVKHEVAESMEIDFTAMYSRPSNKTIPTATTSREEATSPSSAVPDPCGFCQDGTPCICAEMAAEQERHTTATPAHGRQLAQFTPPPSEGDVVSSIGLPRASAGPGTCAQCRADPNSTLFCKSLAASRAKAGLPVDCCGGKGSGGGCCKDSVPLASRATRSKTTANKIQLPPIHVPNKGITLSCADAYTTLSRHPAYERASSEIANWMPKLHANPNSIEGRPALEIDAANVMSVLRDFDRRFGSEK